MMTRAISLLALASCLALLPATVLTQETGTNSTDSSTDTGNTTTSAGNATTTTGNTTTTTGDEDAPPTEVPTCEFPELQGNWLSTFWGPVTLTGTTLTLDSGTLGLTAEEQTALNSFDCFKEYNNGDIILRTPSFQKYGMEMGLFTCVKFEKRNPDLYKITVLLPRDSDENNLPLKKFAYGAGTDPYDKFCGNAEGTMLEGLLLRKGKELEGSLGCPELLRGQFNLSYTGENSDRCPAGGATMTSCRVDKTLFISHESCVQGNASMPPANEEYFCVSGGLDSVTLIANFTKNGEDNPFMCMEVVGDAKDNSTRYVTSKTGACTASWQLPNDQSTPIVETAFTLNYTDDCTPDVVTTPDPGDVDNSTTVDNSTVGINGTDTGNSTDTGNATGSTNDTSINGNSTGTGTEDGPKDVAIAVISNGFLLTTLCAAIALVLANHVTWGR